MQVDRARGLGVVDASLLVVGSIVGAGIFLVSADVASLVRSPAAFYATWLLGGVVSLAGALSNGELGGMFPRSGGEYVYLREAYGPPLGFLSGWTSLLIVFPGSIASLAAGLGGTVAPMLGLGAGWGPKVVASVATVALTVVNAYGLRPGKWTQNVLSGSKLVVFAGLLVLGVVVPRAAIATGAPVEPFFAPGDRAGGIATALVPVLFAYSGWNAATYVAGEMRDPSRTLGRALALGTGLCVVLYLAINAAYLRAMPLAQLATAKEPARDALVALGGSAMGAVLSPLVAVCVLSSMQASVLVGPRIYHAMAEDGLFFQWIGRLSARTGVPAVGLAVQCGITLVLVWVGAFDQLVRFTMSAIIAFSTLTVASVVVLRLRRPEAPRAFRVPGYPLVPAVFVVVNSWMLWNVLTFQDSSPREALVGLGIVATGVPAYLWFARVARLARRARSRLEDVA